MLSYSVIILSKFIFAFYLHDNFTAYSFSEISYAIFWGYRFDFASAGVIAFVVTLFDFHKNGMLIFASFLPTALFFNQLSDILYFHESSRHIGYEITDALVDAKSLFMTAFSQHTIFTLFALLFGVLLFVTLFKYLKLSVVPLNKTYVLKKLFLIALTVFFIRGMVQHIPLNPWQANQIGDSKLASLALNATYNVVYSLANKKKKLQKVKLPDVTQETIKESFARLYPNTSSKMSFPLVKTKPNVVFFFLESWSAAYMKPYGFAHTTTPNFDALLQKSIHPTLMIAGGHRTTEGMFTSLTSLQNPLGKSVAKTQLQSFKYSSIIDTLNKEGYSSAFFQGTSKETSGTGSFAQSLGFEQSYGKRDVIERKYKENYWGVQDPDLYNFASQKLQTTLKEPFVIGINGASTHDDKIPKGVQKIDFVKDKSLNNQLNALHFADKALSSFIAKIEKKYPNTIFVLFADHCGGGLTSSLKNYQIPFAIYSKKWIKPHNYHVVLSQRDIAPTLHDILLGDYKKSTTPFTGKSLVREKNHFFADYYHNGILGWIEGDDLVEINSATNTMECFKIENFKKLQSTCQEKEQIMKENALAFTNISQNMLFSNQLQELKKYTQGKENE